MLVKSDRAFQISTSRGITAAIRAASEAVHNDVLHERFLCFLFSTVSIIIFRILFYYILFYEIITLFITYESIILFLALEELLFSASRYIILNYIKLLHYF